MQSFSSLDLADVYAVISYYLRHRSKIEAYVRRRREQADEVRRENEARFPRKEYESGCLLGVTVPHSPRCWRFSSTRTFTGGL